jgi:hypothetical protein
MNEQKTLSRASRTDQSLNEDQVEVFVEFEPYLFEPSHTFETKPLIETAEIRCSRRPHLRP